MPGARTRTRRAAKRNGMNNTYQKRIKKKDAPDLFVQSVLKNGSDLLSHLRSTIGVNGLNFSVRNGKRWNPATIAT